MNVNKIKIVTIVGARPQFVKAAVVSRALAFYPDVEEVLVHTGQHFDANMSDVFFEEMGIPKPAFHLGVGGGSHGQNTGRALESLEAVLQAELPDLVMVYGDTDSTLAGALAAAKLNIPIAHVEAGLRSFNRRMPEEVNRVLTDHVSTILFAPSTLAIANLAAEGIAGAHIINVGDVMFDAVRYYTARAKEQSTILQTLGLASKQFSLLTLHRKENTDDPVRLRAILSGVAATGERVVFPLHPRTRKRLSEFGIEVPASITLVEPVGYLDMQLLEAEARLIATDSGGVQKEAYFHNVPCVTLRDETEWRELVDAGVNVLVGADSAAIEQAMASFAMAPAATDLYGDGRAANAIAAHLAGVQ